MLLSRLVRHNALFCCVSILISQVAWAQSIRDLGTLDGTNSAATGASADGSVIVGVSYISGDTAIQAFKYVGSTMTSLGTLGGTNSQANSVSADGSVIVGFSDISGDTARHAFKYVGSTMTSLGTLGGTSSRALGVSADGSVIVGESQLAGDTASHAFKYVGSTMTSLGTLGGTSSRAFDVSADGGVIVGESELAGDTASHAFKYVGSTMTSLGTLGGTSSRALGVSADGRVIVGESQLAGDTASHAFAYANATDTMIDIPNTFAALSHNGYQLNSVLNLQNTMLGIGLNLGCDVFGDNNVCVTMGGSYTHSSDPTATTTATNLRIAYRFTSHLHAGLVLDQSLSNSMPSNYTVDNGQPLVGVFAAWSLTGNDVGPAVRFSAAYSNQGTTIERTRLANTEAGQGNSSFVGQGAQLEGAWGLALNDRWTAQPFVGLRVSQVGRSGYSETNQVGFPIKYNTVNQNTTMGYLGVSLKGQPTEKIALKVTLGVEQDLSSNIDDFSGSMYFFGSFNQQAPAIQQTRGFASVGADLIIDKNQRINISALANQQQLNNAKALTGMVSYIIGF